jgi:arabinan endo-1,5-alpha-L-arabinosidase
MQHIFLRLLLLLGLLLAACGNDGQQAQGDGGASAGATTSAVPAASASAAPSIAPSVAASVAAEASAPATPGPGEFVNPVIDRDFPDPDLLKVGDTYYAYATNAAGDNVQAARSTDLVTWERIPDPLPVLPVWVRGGFTWAPEVTTTADGSGYVMYFTARDLQSDKQCIGVATSDGPEGPFTDASEEAFICQLDQGGSIDAASFTDEDGSRYLLWKNDGNCCSLPTKIYIQPVSDDGLTLEGEPSELIENDQFWERAVVEAPTLWKNDGTYYLFYSANNYAGIDYATGYAVADAITGPYSKPSDGPLMSTQLPDPGALGPGGQDIVVDDDGETWIAYHSWDPTATYRRMQIDEIVWEGDTPVVKGPDLTPQPVP